MKHFENQEFVLSDLTEHYSTFLRECDETTSNLLPLSRVDTTDEEIFTSLVEHMKSGQEYGWFQGWGNGSEPNPNWTQYALVVYDNPIPWANCPESQAILANYVGLKSAAFIRMSPHTFLPFHTHPEVRTEGNLQAHLTLDTDPGACLVVDGEVIPHVTGELVVFDGSLPHTAFNGSARTRTILYLEFHTTIRRIK